jgi:hypothetical protein
MAMVQVLQIRHKGLYTSPNEFSSVPQGAMVRAENCIITVDNIIEPRRGLLRLATLPDGNDRLARLAFYQQQMIGAWTGGKVGYRNGSSFTALSGTYDHPEENLARTRFLSSRSNLYFTSESGVYRLDAYNGTPVLAGMYKGLDINLSLSGASGFLADDNQVAYRVLWGIRDAQNNLVLGAPSGRATIANGAGGSRDVSVTFTIPSGITTSYFFQIYRSKASGGAAIEPEDELGLVYENNPTAGEITAGTVTFTDATTDDLRGATIYTAISQQGIAQANERPPQCWDFEEFESCIVYANTKSKQRKEFTILAVGGTGGIQLNDVLTIDGTTYTCKAAESIASREFEQVTGGTPAQNIADTAKSLIKVINRNTTNTTVYAYYLSAPGDLPGRILIEERGVGGTAFAITASATGTAYNPVLPTSGTTVQSSNDDFANGLMFSKSSIQEAVPLINVRRVGSASSDILRVKKLRNSLFIFKEGEGIWRMTGTSPENFQIELFDSSANLLAPDSLAVVNNQIWCLCDQGITVVTETGVSVVSRPIEDLILEQFGQALDEVRYHSFGVGYETERQYMLWTVSSAGDDVATQAFVFNSFTQAYTRWPISRSCGIVSPENDKLYLGDGGSNYLEEERKTRDYTDYIDYGVDYTITDVDGTTITLNTTSEIEVGDLLWQSETLNAVITSVGATSIEVSQELEWDVTTVTVFKAIDVELEYAPITGDNPGVSKQFPELSMLFKAARFEEADLSFATDVSPSYQAVTISGSVAGAWGMGPWGGFGWGGSISSKPIRTFIPMEKQRGSLLRLRFNLRQGYGYFRLLGFSAPVRNTGSYVVAK